MNQLSNQEPLDFTSWSFYETSLSRFTYQPTVWFTILSFLIICGVSTVLIIERVLTYLSAFGSLPLLWTNQEFDPKLLRIYHNAFYKKP